MRCGPARILEILEGMHRVTAEPRYRPSAWLRRRAHLGLSLLTDVSVDAKLEANLNTNVDNWQESNINSYIHIHTQHSVIFGFERLVRTNLFG